MRSRCRAPEAIRFGLLLLLAIGGPGSAVAQKPVTVRIDAVDLAEKSITITYSETVRKMPIAPAMRVTVDDRDATVADIRPGDNATVVYDKNVHAMVRADIWRDKPVDIRLELLEDGGFERISDAANLLRWERQSGNLMSTDTCRHGARAVNLKVSLGNEEARIFSRPRRSIKPGANYRLSVWAKGRGTLAINVYQYGEMNPLGTEFLRDQPSLTLNDEWQQIRCTYRPGDERLKAASMALVLMGKEAQATIDDASFVFAESDNPGIVLDEPRATRKLRIAVETRQADVELIVAGRPVAIADGIATAHMAEGLVPIAARAAATGYRPGVKIRVLGNPEADGRWRASDQDASGWQTVEFDDRPWPTPFVDRTGFAWTKNERSKRVCFRQVLLWNEAPHGPDRCLLPRARDWAMSKDGFDNLLLALYSPLPFNLDDYEFVLDMPKQFELFGIDEKFYNRYVTNQCPARVVREAIERGGQAYTRHRIAFSPQQVPADATHYSWLPIRLRGGEPGTTTTFFFHRRGHGNFIECEQAMPVTILPPVNGRQPKRVMLSQYCPMLHSALSPPHAQAVIERSAAMGFNFAALTITDPGWGPQWNAYQRNFYDTLTTRGLGTMLGNPGQFPLHGSHVPGHQSDAFLRWVAATPQAQAAYFDGRRWNAERDDMYCPSFMIGEGAKRFRDIVTRTYAEMLARTPNASVLFLDYEAPPWLTGTRFGLGGSYCFCDRCKQQFRERAKLPPEIDLSNQAIYDKHYQQWADFHDWQVTEIQSQMKAVANALGLKYMFYSYAGYMPLWSNIAGKVDIAFPGSPGNNVAVGSIQKHIDEEGRFLRVKQAVPTVIGQRFSVLGMDESKGAWKELNALSDDGFVQAKSWKSQILRTVAAFGGGLDLQNSQECVAGMPYWIGEATRIIAAHEDLFLNGERADQLASSKQIAYPDLLVLRKGRRRLVLLFNEGRTDRAVTLENLGLELGQKARVFESEAWQAAESMQVVVPAGDALAVEVE
jgi:hypothetical protein